MIDPRIAKPRVHLPAGSLVASTDALLQSSGVAVELLERTAARTPLGAVVVARLREGGAVEVAGPSAAEQVREASEAMLAHGARRVLIDGAIDRRAASSPAVSDGLVMATGAVLSTELEQVVARTKEAVELTRLPPLAELPEAAREAALAIARGPGEGDALLDASGELHALAPRFLLSAAPEALRELLTRVGEPSLLLARGAVPEQTLEALADALRRRSRTLALLVRDPTHLFLRSRGVDWYRRQGLALFVLEPIELRAITVNPVAPESHHFDSGELRSRLAAVIEGVPVLDVCHPDYPAAHAPLAG